MRLLAAPLLLLAVARAQDDPPKEPREAEDRAPDTSLGIEVEKYLEEAEPQPSGTPLDGRWFTAPIFESEDNAFLVRLRGRLLIDGYWATSDEYDSSVTADGVFVRQARLGVAGHVYTNVIYMLEYEFLEGPMIPPPHRTCGADPTEDGLSCAEFACP